MRAAWYCTHWFGTLGSSFYLLTSVQPLKLLFVPHILVQELTQNFTRFSGSWWSMSVCHMLWWKRARWCLGCRFLSITLCLLSLQLDCSLLSLAVLRLTFDWVACPRSLAVFVLLLRGLLISCLVLVFIPFSRVLRTRWMLMNTY